VEIYERIKARRTDLGLTLQEVADALHVSKSTILRYESKDILNMGIDKVEPLAKILKTTPAYILGWEELNVPENKSELIDEVNDLFVKLAPEKQEQVLSFLRFLHGQEN
jgi:Predicted transcriptional regulators